MDLLLMLHQMFIQVHIRPEGIFSDKPLIIVEIQNFYFAEFYIPKKISAEGFNFSHACGLLVIL
jgi:hypothetical protein